MNHNTSITTSDARIDLPMIELKQLSDPSMSGTTMFEPQSSIDKHASSASIESPSPNTNQSIRLAPEKKLTLFALRLAILEKAATGLGTLGFIWATVVLLGGFAITLHKTDFWSITTILLIEATRIYGRSHELEWQHQASWSLVNAGRDSFRLLRSSSRFLMRVIKSIFSPMSVARSDKREFSHQLQDRGRAEIWRIKKSTLSRQWATPEVPLLPYAQWVFVAKNVSKFLHWLQIVAGFTCVVLSLMKLIRQDYGDVDDNDKKNRNAALIIFYSLALAEASFFLLEKAYWELEVVYFKLLEDVTKDCELQGSEGLVSVKRFFYDAYSKCLDGSIFDGLKMDMVSFAMELMVSDCNTFEEQLIGARILRKFATSERFSDDTLQKIGVTFTVMERLVEILNWKDPQQEEMRQSAAEILAKLASKKQNSLRVAGIPGAMESISSLLYTSRSSRMTNAADEIGERSIVLDEEHYGFWTFNHIGLQLLKKLARDHDNCGKMGTTRGLLVKIIDFTHAGERILKEESVPVSQIQTIKRSLQVVRLLASTTGATGKQLRRQISEIVFTVSNIRDILRYGDKHPNLQHLGIEILRFLGLEDDATERIGGTGGILKELLKIFFKAGDGDSQNAVRIAAGEALAMLVLESESNCVRILRVGALEELVRSLEVPLLRQNAARILRNLCIYSGEDCFVKLRGVIGGVPSVLKGIKSEDSKLQEVMVGLAASTFGFMTPEESRAFFERAGMTEDELGYTLVEILKKYPNPPSRVPRIRRFTIELAIWMMKENGANTSLFKNLELVKELENVLDTTSEIETFDIFSGTVGVSKYRTTMYSLVQTAMDLLEVK